MRKWIASLIVWLMERFDLRRDLNKWEKKEYDELKARMKK